MSLNNYFQNLYDIFKTENIANQVLFLKIDYKEIFTNIGICNSIVWIKVFAI